MKNSRLLQLIKPLSKKECSRFRAFSASPYFNKHQKVKSLVNYLHDACPDYSGDICDRRTIFRHIFPGEEFDYQQLFLIASYTTRLLETFLVEEALREENAARKIALLRRLRTDDQEVLYQKKLKSWQKELQKAPLKNSQHHFASYLFAEEADMAYRKRGKHEWDPNIQRKQDELDCFYISEKLRDSCEMITRKRILKVDYQPALLEAILVHVESNQEHFSQFPAVMVYFQLYRLLTGHLDASLSSSLIYLQEHNQCFHKGEQQQLYNSLLNYCIWHINRGEKTYHAKALEIIRWQLQHELIFHGDYLPEWHYKNIVVIGLRAGQYDWVYRFIEDYRFRLHPHAAPTAYPFSLASYYYSSGQLEKVQELLAGIDYQDERYYLAIKALLLRTYFDLGEYEALGALSDAFRQHMKRNKLMSNDRNQALRNLFHLTKKTTSLLNRIGYDSIEKLQPEWKKLKDQVLQTQLLINKEWLVGRLEELESKFFKTKKAH